MDVDSPTEVSIETNDYLTNQISTSFINGHSNDLSTGSNKVANHYLTSQSDLSYANGSRNEAIDNANNTYLEPKQWRDGDLNDERKNSIYVELNIDKKNITWPDTKDNYYSSMELSGRKNSAIIDDNMYDPYETLNTPANAATMIKNAR